MAVNPLKYASHMRLSCREYGFINIINTFSYKVGIEIGVRNAVYSEWLLKHTNLEKLYSIDIQLQHDTLSKLEKFGIRSEFILAESPGCASRFEDGSIDFIYIDANHSFQQVYDDLVAWWPKIRFGGMMCGDDYTHVYNPYEGLYGVVEAVEKFALENKIDYGVTGTGTTTLEEKNRVATGMGKIIEKCLTGELKGIQFGVDVNTDDIRIPQWFMFKQ